MRKLLLLTLIVGFFVYEQASRAAAPAAAVKHYTACALMTSKDAKSLIGADADLQKDSSSDNHCYYRSSAGAAYLHIADASGHLWLDYKTKGNAVKGVGDEAYFYPLTPDMGNTLMVRKGDVAIMINAQADGLSDEKIQSLELAFSRRMAARL